MNLPTSIVTSNQVYLLSIAPMMDRTDRHYRYFMRQITRRTLLYTEMVTTAAILHGDQEQLLGFSPEEKPLVLQLGGDNPNHLATCAKIAEDMGYDQVNLNVGCPSDRVQNGNFGACLMAQPELVAKAVEAMQKVVNIPVTIKHRIGIDDQDKYEDMAHFVRIVANAGCQHFSVHARKAWLQGLSPKENRTIPPLRYEEVHRLKQEFPQLFIEINGGFKTLTEVKDQLQFVDAVMIGRAAYDHPYLFATADQEIYGEKTPPLTRQEVIEAMYPYLEYWLQKGVKLNSITRHFLELFARQPGTKAWKRYISENAHLTHAGVEVLEQALKQLP
ncbi:MULTISPECIES: tRNA dihydrouridine(20/20a) synthase DusA [Planktothrix]|uniref:tRNA dihydrouridine(20/20a) synthase DusA n=1 Tax=Planktothrix TaxID=54304 RepID=UPI00047D9C3A|nr:MULTISPECIES: tRNA dihydrouridine(20/20a) synthase DusA [Planktothrix]CAD0228452.1 tRNA-dihydrouridine synthase A [Planktothrix agardhii]CAD5932166.1 tRNA-dihydrouridine(20/20a) synthase [Planktothrix agardhii]